MVGIYERFAAVAARFGDRTAIELLGDDGVESWSYERLRLAAEAAAARLRRAGVERGERVAILADNDAVWCASYLGAMRLGAVPVPLDIAYSPSQIAKLLGDCSAAAFLSSEAYESTASAALDGLGRPCPLLPMREADPTDTVGATAPAALGETDPAVILYTSGTTSDPKGVVLTHGNLAAEIDSARQVVTITDDDAVLGVLPLFHALAQLANLLLPLTIGARVVFLGTLDSATLLRALQERGITAFACVPQFFYLIHARVFDQIGRAPRPLRWLFRVLLCVVGVLRERTRINLGPYVFRRVHRALGPRMRLLVTGGSRFDPEIGRDLYRLGFNILQAYGLTETSGAATVLRPGDPHVGTVGHPLPGVEVKILTDPPAGDDDGRDGGGYGEHDGRPVGEVLIRGPIVMSGYWQRDDANAEAFLDGWFRSGDLGYLDDAGRVRITGRAKDVIVLGSGKNVYPEEIEAHYARSEYIAELCVMGRARPDQPEAEQLHAVIVPDFDLLRDRKILNAREWVRWDLDTLSAKLPPTKRVMSYELVSEPLPRTTTRKLKRFAIAKMLAGRGEGEAAGLAGPVDEAAERAWLDDPRVSAVVEVVRAAVASPEAVRKDASLELDLGLDSMQRVELLAAVESRLAVSVPDAVSHEIRRVGELVDAVVEAGADGRVARDGDRDAWRGLLADVSEHDPAVAPILEPRPVAGPLLYVFSRLLRVVARVTLGLRVDGVDQLPPPGAYLISPNHQSYLDAFVLAAALPRRVFRNTFYVGASEYFDTPLMARIARLLHVVPVDPDTNLVRAMRAGAEGLRRERTLILFPEGERSIDREVKQFKKGAAILATNVGVPIVPVALDGLHDVWPRGEGPRWSRLIPFVGPKARVRFGAPIAPPPLDDDAAATYDALTGTLRDEVERLLAELRGEERAGRPAAAA